MQFIFAAYLPVINTQEGDKDNRLNNPVQTSFRTIIGKTPDIISTCKELFISERDEMNKHNKKLVSKTVDSSKNKQFLFFHILFQIILQYGKCSVF